MILRLLFGVQSAVRLRDRSAAARGDSASISIRGFARRTHDKDEAEAIEIVLVRLHERGQHIGAGDANPRLLFRRQFVGLRKACFERSPIANPRMLRERLEPIGFGQAKPLDPCRPEQPRIAAKWPARHHPIDPTRRSACALQHRRASHPAPRYRSRASSCHDADSPPSSAGPRPITVRSWTVPLNLVVARSRDRRPECVWIRRRCRVADAQRYGVRPSLAARAPG